ncbi:MAG: polysaccharide biosynthesis protein, partial [Actinomycetia bacterium]|nr:polysaccharide biosynthesis protein [Actinomycetes bacterium]
MDAQAETEGRFALPTQRDVLRLGVDGIAWFLGMFFAAYARFDFDLGDVDVWPVLGFALVAVTLQWLIGTALFLYRGRYRYGSFDEVSGVATTVMIVGVLLAVIDRLIFNVRPVPASTPLVGAFVALVLMLGVRYIWRVRLERSTRPDESTATKVLVFGAGDAGYQLVQSMMRDPQSAYLPVGLLDDSPRVRNLRVRGVSVLGGRADISAVAAQTDASAIVIAIASASAVLVRDISEIADNAGLAVKILPTLGELIDGKVSAADIRDVSEADLLGRHVIETDVESIAHYLTGRRILVTGAGGSIGSELCRQIHRFGPAELIMLDRDESALHAVELSIHGRALLDDDSTVLADIRDADRIREVFIERRPHVVFHAAALKHLPMLERAPAEAVKSNVWGTQNVLDAAVAADVDRFVNISTDKA